jgi:hypothetical protein
MGDCRYKLSIVTTNAIDAKSAAQQRIEQITDIRETVLNQIESVKVRMGAQCSRCRLLVAVSRMKFVATQHSCGWHYIHGA